MSQRQEVDICLLTLVCLLHAHHQQQLALVRKGSSATICTCERGHMLELLPVGMLILSRMNDSGLRASRVAFSFFQEGTCSGMLKEKT
eukprot:1152901-Pelagomonas_calceolata.AAC.8